MNLKSKSSLMALHRMVKFLASGALVLTATAIGAQTPGTSAKRGAAPASNVSAISTTTPTLSSVAIEGKTVDGKAFTMSSLKGKVVLVLFWSTDCAVCRDKMPELRSNYAGWSGKPFEVVAVNTNTSMKEFLDYERILSITVPMKQRFVQLWAGDSSYQDNVGKLSELPIAFVINKAGVVVERYMGRIPAAAWDAISDLL